MTDCPAVSEAEELEAYRSARRYDALMSGPVFTGWNMSALNRARRLTETNLAAPPQPRTECPRCGPTDEARKAIAVLNKHVPGWTQS